MKTHRLLRNILVFLIAVLVSRGFWISGSIAQQEKIFTSYSNCTGTAPERRALVERGGSLDDWRNMARCVRRRQAKLVGHFALHVSKSGGTSLCKAFQKEQCSAPYNSNCWIRTDTLDFSPQWVRKPQWVQFQLPKWALIADKEDVSCSELRDAYIEYSKSVLMSENWLPTKEGLCPEYFMNTIMFREPTKRLESHYHELYDLCLRFNSHQACDHLLILESNATTSDDVRSFDTPAMAAMFDVVTDNLYARSLNGKAVYESRTPLDGAALQTAIEHVGKFDWVLIVGSDNPTTESKHNNYVLRHGLGLHQDLGVSNARKHRNNSSSGIDLEFLQPYLRLDYALWEEAKRLQWLDVQSLRLMARHAEWWDESSVPTSRDKSCCGGICMPG